ncbi:MAG: PAS domain S-box protein [Anaerolineae bacterium CFX3]|nr:PAS domain S-box protein [Anaerolineae bacterium CFX3]MCQ3945555.1 hypothetical protein [Anaerolineae bacterium]RIK27297.1 MAG: hypothetical protein DCC54_03760 [Anaerolineae bacterium]
MAARSANAAKRTRNQAIMKNDSPKPQKTKIERAGKAAVRESESRYRRLFESAPDGILIVDAETGTIVDANPRFLAMLGYPLDEIAGKEIWRIHADAQSARRAFAGLLEKGFVRHNHLPLKKRDGQLAQVECVGIVYRDGKRKFAQCHFRDIDEQVRAVEALAERERRFRSMIENSYDAIALLNAAGNVVYASPAGVRITGFSMEERIGRSGFELVHPLDLENCRREFARLVQTPFESASLQYRTRHKNGAWIWVEVAATNLLDEPAVEAIVVNYRDITERRQAEAALAEAQKLQNLILESVGEGIHGLDSEGRIVFENEASLEMFGWEAKEMLGQNAHALTHHHRADGGVYPAEECPIHLTLRDGETRRVADEAFFRKDGSSFPVEYTCSAMKDDGTVTGVVVSFRDITERRRIEDEIREEKIFSDAIINSLPGTFYLFDEQGRFLRWNENFETVSGYSAEEIKRVGPLDFFEGQDKELIRQRIGQAFGESEAEVEAEFVSRDGSRTPYYFSGKRVELNGMTCLIGVGVDLTARRRAEQALIKSEKAYRDLFNNASDAILIFEPRDEIILQANATACRLYGFEYDEMIGKSLKSLTRNVDRGAAYINFFLRGEASSIFESAHFKKDGEEIAVLVNSSLIEYEGRQAVLALVRDVTDRKRAEEALKKSEARLSEAQRIAHLGNWEWNIPSNVVWWSDENYRIFGLRPGELELTLEGFLKTVHPEDRAMVADAVNRALQDGVSWSIHHRIILPDGGQRFIQERAVVEFDKNGRPARMAGTTLDVTDRKRAEENIQKQLGRLKALHEVDTAITGSFDTRTSLTVLLRRATTELGADAASVLLLSPNLNLLEFAAGYGFRTRAIEQSSLRADEGHAGRAVMQRSLVRIADLEERRQLFPRASLLADEKFVCYFGVPLISKGTVKGVLEIFHRSPLNPDPDWLDFLQTLADQAAIAVENAQLFSNLQQSNFELQHAYDATIEGWSRALDLRDKETEGHTQRVTNMAIRLGRKFGLSNEELRYVRWGGLLHDIGKMGVPDAILLKKEALTPEEMTRMKRHPAFAYEMLSPIRYLKNALDIPYCHHEKWDGTGYPRGLKGEQIPIPARIFAVVDVYDALTSDRPYRDKWEREEAISYIREQAGSRFDPDIVEMFLRMIEDDLAYGSPG